MAESVASVVIPAHDEELVIERCLGRLAGDQLAPSLEVLVVANGCSDQTAEVARSFRDRLPGLSVLELGPASKVAALNAGDTAATALPRIYLDADIELLPGALASMVRVLSVPEAVVASPSVRFDCQQSSWPVRSFFSIFEQMPYVLEGLVGLGVYGVSRAGRRRFSAFPDVVADDLFVQELFTPAERRRSDGAFVVSVPRRTSDLIAVRSRGAKGKAELAATGASPNPLRESATPSSVALTRLVRADLRRLPAAATYVAVTLAARRRAARSDERWARDGSSRTGDPVGRAAR
jgi:glycosyltransferase involved in cell wall biosynthesis